MGYPESHPGRIHFSVGSFSQLGESSNNYQKMKAHSFSPQGSLSKKVAWTLSLRQLKDICMIIDEVLCRVWSLSSSSRLPKTQQSFFDRLASSKSPSSSSTQRGLSRYDAFSTSGATSSESEQAQLGWQFVVKAVASSYHCSSLALPEQGWISP